MTRIGLVVLDTLRKDAFEDYFEWLPGTYYPNTYSTANWTVPAHASLFTGYYSTEVNATAKSTSLDTPDPVLAELFRDAGFRTVGYSANPNVSTKTQFNRGFEEFTDPTELKNPEGTDTMNPEVYGGTTDKEGLALYLGALREILLGDYDTIPSIKLGIGQKFGYRPWQKSIDDDGASVVRDEIEADHPARNQFTFVNLMEAHTPYDPPAEFSTVDEPVSVTLQNMVEGVDDPEKVRRAYDDAARYLSHVYKSIFESMAADYDYVVTLSDHGEMLGEHGMWNHTYGLYSQLTNVPLVITDCSELDASFVDERPVSLVDVHRTLLELAGLSAPSRGWTSGRRSTPSTDCWSSTVSSSQH
ncbi:sulfatase-like hydrolase/transferase [Haloarculaceae archaeon H-GB2-1]|nr:sulfatase-like hydrolase/transferase [Haloarculaceae archaeon H-GB2-1]